MFVLFWVWIVIFLFHFLSLFVALKNIWQFSCQNLDGTWRLKQTVWVRFTTSIHIWLFILKIKLNVLKKKYFFGNLFCLKTQKDISMCQTFLERKKILLILLIYFNCFKSTLNRTSLNIISIPVEGNMAISLSWFSYINFYFTFK